MALAAVFACLTALAGCALALRELFLLRRLAAARLGGRHVPGSSGLLGRKSEELITELSLLCRRMEALEWERKWKKEHQLRGRFRGPDQAEKIFERMLEGFRCKAAALILFKRKAGDDLKFHLRGIEGRKFEQQLLSFIDFYRSRRCADTPSQLECAQPSSVTGDFSQFGVRHVVCFPLAACFDDPVGMLWLGYPPGCEPLSSEVSLARDLALELGSEILRNAQLDELSSRLAELQDADQKKSDFIAQMSHDIRSPLNNIRSILSLLRLERSSGDLDEMIDVALANCDSLSDLVESILDYSRHKAGKLSAAPRLFDLGACAEAVVAGFLISARLKGLELLFQNRFDKCPVFADTRQIKRIITNLVSNAIKYTRSGTVRVSIRRHAAGRWGLSVKDTGCGLSLQQQKTIFTPFTTFKDATDGPARPDGVGLGLALSRILAELNGARIQVHSKPGSGSDFELSLPCAEVCAQTASLLSREQNPGEQAGSKVGKPPSCVMPLPEGSGSRTVYTVLLVDDEADCIDTLAMGLDLPQARILKAFTVRDAVSICNFDPPDVIITDAEMPGGGAKAFLRFLMTKGKCAAVAILSGRGNEDSAAEFMRLGAARVFVKPADLFELAAWVKNAAGAVAIDPGKRTEESKVA